MNQKEVSGNVFDLKVLKRLFTFIRPYRKRFHLLICLTMLSAALGPLLPYLVRLTIDDYIAKSDYTGMLYMLAALIGLLVVQAITQYFHTFMSGWVSQYIIRDIRTKLYRKITYLKLKFYDNTPIGRLVTRTVSDVETLSDVFSNGFAAMFSDVLQIFIILGIMFSTSWQLTLVSLSTLPLLILSTYVFKEKIKSAFNSVRNAVSNLNSFVQEHVTGMPIVQIFNSEEREYKKFEAINEDHKKANLRSVLYYSIYFPVAEVIQASGIGLLVWYGAGNVMNESITIGVLVSFIMYIQMFFRPIRMIADRFNVLQMGVVSTSRIFHLLDSEEYIPDHGTYPAKDVKGKVKFENVSFAYIDEDYVLKDISFDIEPGQTLALVGATGAGKSSIINLLSRFYDINKGHIYIDDVDIKDYQLRELRRNIGVVLQDVFLFSDTIEENITLRNDDVPLGKIKEAAELVGARKFIENLPGAYDYNVMERGATLSMGQRQLISFVRAMVYNPKIIVLDEATSSVDTETEELIQQAIDKLMKGRTSIVIAHRLSTIQKADKIIVLDKGEVKEVGTHEQLLGQNGYYSKLYKIQFEEMAVTQ